MRSGPVLALKARFRPNIDHCFRFNTTLSHNHSQPLLLLGASCLKKPFGTHPGSTCSRSVKSIFVICLNCTSEKGLDTRFRRLETRHACSRPSAMSRPNCLTFWCLRLPSARLDHLANRKTKISCFPNSTRFEYFRFPGCPRLINTSPRELNALIQAILLSQYPFFFLLCLLVCSCH